MSDLSFLKSSSCEQHSLLNSNKYSIDNDSVSGNRSLYDLSSLFPLLLFSFCSPLSLFPSSFVRLSVFCLSSHTPRSQLNRSRRLRLPQHRHRRRHRQPRRRLPRPQQQRQHRHPPRQVEEEEKRGKEESEQQQRRGTKT
jgi:hypothetical protein